MTADRLAERWPLPGLQDVRDELLAAYGDPARRYHDLRHLTEVLDRVDELEGAGTRFDRTTVVLAAWFHDGVHDGAPSDEQRSAAWASSALAGAVPAPVVETVARLVRMTATHLPADADEAVLSDADLAILAAPRDRYEEYAAAVREEYAHVPDDAFRAGRAAILRDLLAKPQLFDTAHGRTRWEAAARANLSSELTRLAPS